MPEWENGSENEDELSEEQQEQIYNERMDEIKVLTEQDEHPLEPETDEPHERKKLKRELRDEALTRMEDAARTVGDFQNIVKEWDKLDRNRERRERYYEVLRNGDDIPLDYGASPDAPWVPNYLNCVLTRQLRHGYFLDAIFYCPFEIHELVTDACIHDILKSLKEEQKELLFLWAVREYSSARIAAIRDQTDRNIRKVRNTLMKRIQKKLLVALKEKERKGQPLKNREKVFLAANNKTALDESKDG
ncbi:MAG: hypothetical protein ENTB_01864 [Enterocloster aldenensis]